MLLWTSLYQDINRVHISHVGDFQLSRSGITLQTLLRRIVLTPFQQILIYKQYIILQSP